MKHTALLIFFLLFTQACDLGNDAEPNLKDTAQALDNIKKLDAEFINNANEFSFNLMDKVLEEAPKDKNILVSPLSINIALGMLYNGAKGNSAKQIIATLGLDGKDAEAINANYRNLLNALPNLSNEVDMSIANSVWHDDDFAVKDQFLENLINGFDAEVKAEDFGDANTPVMINNWVKEHTKGKIDEIIDSISPQEVMLLINALYFNGSWTFQFNPEKTTTQTFTNALGQEKNVQMMMHDKVKLRGTGREDFAIFELPYGENERFALRILLPNHDQSLDEVFTKGSDFAWNGTLALGSESNVMVGLPKFEIKDEYKLNDILISLGIEDVFDSQKSDLGNISDKKLNVSKVKHKTFMKVDESGTEAAAVTSVGIEVTSMPPSYICNRPFAFYIYEREMGNILFMGRVVDVQ